MEEAKTKSDDSQINERIKLAVSAAYTRGEGEISPSLLEEELTNVLEGKTFTLSNNGDAGWIVEVDGKNYQINSDGKISNAKFYVYHSSTAEVTEHEYCTTFNITQLVQEGYIYAGYFTDYINKGNYDISNPTTGTFGTPYEGDQNTWQDDDSYKECGLHMNPIAGKTYFLKELPIKYLRPATNMIWSSNNNLITGVYLITAADDACWKGAGFIISDSNGSNISTNPVDSFYRSCSFNGTRHYPEYYFGEDLRDVAFLSIYEYFRNQSGMTPNYQFEFTPYAITQDDVKISIQSLSCNAGQTYEDYTETPGEVNISVSENLP